MDAMTQPSELTITNPLLDPSNPLEDILPACASLV
jgi:hypothetical protein